jgi:hypothetical protein
MLSDMRRTFVALILPLFFAGSALAAALAAAPLSASAAGAPAPGDHRCLHDLNAGTRVVKGFA